MRPLLLFLCCLACTAASLAGGTGALDQTIARLRSQTPVATSEKQEIEAAVSAALSADPADPRAKYARALLDRSNGNAKTAKEAVEALAKAYPERAEYHATLGTLCFESINDAGTFEKMSLASKGRAEYEKAIELDPNLVEPYVGLGRFYRMAPGYAGGSYKKAEEQARLLIAIPEGKGELFGRSLLADIYADKGQWELVQEQYQLAEKAPGATTGYAFRAYATALLNKKKDPAAALVVLEKYQAVASPDDASPWYLTAEAKRALGKLDDAIAMYNKVLTINAAAVNSRYSLAETLEKVGRFGDAATQYKEFASRFPSDPRAAKATEAAARCQGKAK